MSRAAFLAMLLSLVRDRGAIAMTFVLPALFFWIFAVIFAGSTGDQLRLEVAVANEVGDEISDRLLAALAHDGSLILVHEGKNVDRVRDMVRRGTADVGLVRDDLRSVADAIETARMTMRVIQQNLFFAFVYNVIGVPIAAGVLFPFTGLLLNPMVASAAMAMSSVSVVTNSLRLRRKPLASQAAS